VANDYVTWVIVGVACIGGVLAYTIRWLTEGYAG